MTDRGFRLANRGEVWRFGLRTNVVEYLPEVRTVRNERDNAVHLLQRAGALR